MANVVYLSKTLLTGGTAPALDSIDGTGLVDGDFAHVTVAGILYVYKLNATLGGAESIPTIIAPDTNAGTKRWVLQGVNANGLVDNSLTASLPLFTGASKELVSKSVAATLTALGQGVDTARPAFLVQASLQSDVTGDGTGYTVIFNTEIFDQASNFDGVSTFTAPVTGKYLLSVVLTLGGLAAANTLGLIYIVTSNRSIQINYGNYGAQASGTGYLTLNGSLIFDMDANDTATIYLSISGGTKIIDVLATSYFSGTLIC